MKQCRANLGCENETTLEFMDIMCCEDCLHDYWKDNDIGERESFEDFIDLNTSSVQIANKEDEKSEN